MFLVIGAALYLAYANGAHFESLLFYGDFKAWVNGDLGTGTPFMFLLLLPLCYLGSSWALERAAGAGIRARQRSLPKTAAGVLDLGRWTTLLLAGAVLSYLAARGLTVAGFDPRGGVVDTYVQRNALVVGFVMGFAIIPTIYTLAEDALNSVPSHVRAASLAAGATSWQTAKWVILPTAMSGVFAACMIGMGRAVGETMIVLMAAGNTPLLEWNIFNGLRTLSANIAVELPEAVQGDTLYPHAVPRRPDPFRDDFRHQYRGRGHSPALPQACLPALARQSIMSSCVEVIVPASPATPPRAPRPRMERQRYGVDARAVGEPYPVGPGRRAGARHTARGGFPGPDILERCRSPSGPVLFTQ
jgi:ABC-type amino acid transport system permease subunit